MLVVVVVVVVVAVLACEPRESPPVSGLVFSAAIIPLHRMGWGRWKRWSG